MTNFVLVHGAMHGGWVWESVWSRLIAHGHEVARPDLAGSGLDVTPLEHVSLGLISRRIADAALDLGNCDPDHGVGEPVVLVGQGMGGLVIGEVAERIPQFVLGLVYVSAALVPPGQSVLQTLGHAEGRRFRTGQLNGDDTVLRPDRDTARKLYFGAATPDRADRAARRLVRQVTLPLEEPTTVTDEEFGLVPRAYVECLRDQAISIETQRAMQSVLPCDPVLTLDADHTPSLSAPDELADALISIAEKFEARGRQTPTH